MLVPTNPPVAFAPFFDKPTWVNWQYRADKKVPMQPNSSGRYAFMNNPRTWGTYAECARRAVTLDAARAQCNEGYDPLSMVRGIGFVHSHQHNIVTIDIDAKKLGGPSDPRFRWMLELHDAFNTYTEASPSGRGCHIVGSISGGDGDEICDRIWNGASLHGCVDFFADFGYVTVTGAVTRDLPILDITAPLIGLLRKEGVQAKPSGGTHVEMQRGISETQAYIAASEFDPLFQSFMMMPVPRGARRYSRAIYALCRALKLTGCPPSLALRMIEAAPVTTQSRVEHGDEERIEKLHRTFDKTWEKI
ncbi:hypothetical protein [Rhizobium ruizarguesonis]|uniref:hypothetical protein n=1 Tax=Rhizobium ruizarguesonis TaxID=2081791 RepID=UPI0013B9A839|nr:hypothetical protein [Rhizobium ruizarguesonis]NEH64595.1 hypothetical protein [Rhizobium ruizarguesonis]NEH78087.1 hypothetical protein [Rhizobium ruizarguesonis]NEI78518.1 hypothetical protein [Rhizobium ruizarguesonis]